MARIRMTTIDWWRPRILVLSLTALAHFCSLHAGVPRHVERKYR